MTDKKNQVGSRQTNHPTAGRHQLQRHVIAVLRWSRHHPQPRPGRTTIRSHPLSGLPSQRGRPPLRPVDR
jgi:hypothetical protein